MAKQKSKLRLAGREQALASIAIAIVLICISDYFVLRPILRRLSDLDVQTRQVRDEVVYYGKILRQRDQVESQFKTVQDQLKQTSTPQMHHSEFLSIMDEIASKAGLTLTKLAEGEAGPLSTGPGPISEELVELVVNAESEGSIAPLVTFLHMTQEHPAVLRVRRMTLAPKGKPEQNVTRGSIEVTRVLAE